MDLVKETDLEMYSGIYSVNFLEGRVNVVVQEERGVLICNTIYRLVLKKLLLVHQKN